MEKLILYHLFHNIHSFSFRFCLLINNHYTILIVILFVMHTTRNVAILPSLFKNQNVNVRNPIDKQDFSYQLSGITFCHQILTLFVKVLFRPDAILLKINWFVWILYLHDITHSEEHLDLPSHLHFHSLTKYQKAQ